MSKYTYIALQLEEVFKKVEVLDSKMIENTTYIVCTEEHSIHADQVFKMLAIISNEERVKRWYIDMDIQKGNRLPSITLVCEAK